MSFTNDLLKTIQDRAISQCLIEFFSDTANGEPDNITKIGCIKLAAYGAEVWNTWRILFPAKPYGHFAYRNISDFSHTDFIGYRKINFAEFIFGDGANFSFCKWERNADFFKCTWGDHCCFIGTNWGVRSTFNLVKIGDHCDFTGCSWGHDCSFEKANIGHNADFSNTHWGGGICFNETSFGSSLNFNFSIWDGSTNFSGSGARGLSNINITFPKDNRTLLILNAKSSNIFLSVSFRAAKFLGEVYFDDRIFTGQTDFSSYSEVEEKSLLKRGSDKLPCISDGKLIFITPKNDDLYTVFRQPPSFHSAKLHVQTFFTGAKFPEIMGTRYNAAAYRSLKILFTEIQSKFDYELFEKLEIAEEKKYREISENNIISKNNSKNLVILNNPIIQKTIAIIISIENYKDRDEDTISPVKYAENDAQAFKNTLIQQMGVEDKDIHFFINDKAIKSDLENELKDIYYELGENDQLIFYYAGHGFHNGITNLLTTYDTNPKYLEGTTISLREVLLDPLKTIPIPCKRVLVFIDSCAELLQKDNQRSIIRSINNEDFKLIISEFPNYSIFLSCNVGQRSFSCDELKHGVWTYHLIQALSGKAAKNIKDNISVTDESLRNYLSENVSKYVKQHLNQNQNPKAILESGYDNIILNKNLSY